MPVRRARVALRTKVYVFVLLLIMPIDYFQPTGTLLREGGAKPAIPLMTLGAAWIIWRHWSELLFACPKLWRTLLALCCGITFLSTFAFVANVGLAISSWGGTRSPWGQFVSQGALFVLVAPVLITHAWLFSKSEVRPILFRFVPTVTLLHLLVILAEGTGVLSPNALPLSLFRGAYAIIGRRPTGLMTEPSYVGAFAATYGLVLWLCMPDHRRRNRLLAAVAITLAVGLGGKTVVPALFVGLIAYGYQIRAKVFNLKGAAAAATLAAITAYTVLTYSVLDVQSNLSSAMRFGSTVLALNAAVAGYGLLGIGFGQFHFIYKPEFAPFFLNYSPEAQSYFAGTLDVRASTYNLLARYLIEEGALGFLLFCAVTWLTFRNGRAQDDAWHRCGAVITGTSLGFLLTQDTYFFPAFVFGCAILASRSRQVERLPC